MLIQCDMRAAVGIVLKTFNDTRDTVLVTTEIYQAVMLFMPAASVASGDATCVVATSRPRLLFSSGLCGAPLCRSGVLTWTTNRRPGDVGLP